ncbi:ATP-binding cassette domain-containing protein [Solwaraspora sp. WMMD1047]|uniref:ABC transporter ATP-binding protein/permease n=1 Tax=Solwaraspora sp. WMMD1047 TaxID=3016102 RepID=UPI002416ECD0|nr:ATP-binding cassette domain-containing protein [Solwaraspora sp. WMMD1047]MDG4831745.1 ATP-binding cassette domain-containing protein [Solwaraspora sp. WMMD1047]
MRRLRTLIGAALLTVPLALAVLGPVLAGEPGARTFPFAGDGPLGTDFVGRDVGQQVLLGGRSVVVVAVCATLLAYLVGVPVGLLAAATRRRWVDELLMRPFDLALAVPSLLLLILLAATAPPGPATLVGIVALIGLPEIARITRAAALPLAHGPAMEAMRLYRESWWRRGPGYVGTGIRRVLLADAGVRFIGAIYLVATASFLGIGVAPDAADWAVMVDRNRAGLFLQPWAVAVPAALIISLAVGLNLVTDRMLATGGTTLGPAPRPTPAAAGDAPAPGGPLLRVRDLTAATVDRTLVDGVSFDLTAGEILAVIGASGSGKTTTGRALLGEVTPGVTRTGTITVAGRSVTAATPPKPGTVGYVPQQPAAALNPVRRIGSVLHEIARRRLPADGRSARRRAVTAVLERVSLPADRRFLRRFPHQLSGGQQQRLVIAHALLARAVLLIADEPTTGQDALTRDDVARELTKLTRDGIAVVLLSHDLHLVRAVADQILVLDRGTAVEYGPAAEVLATPRHGQTRELLAAPPPRPPAAVRDDGPLLLVTGLSAAHRDGGRQRDVVRDVDLAVAAGQCLAVVGRSGSGKTTLARCLAGLHAARTGQVSLAGQRLAAHLDRRQPHELAAIQYVFQDARASFDPHRPVLDQTAGPARRLRDAAPERARRAALELLELVGLTEPTVTQRPDRLSGGELHRAAMARALACEPRVLICDETTAGLDRVTQHGILTLLDDLRRSLRLTVVVISHDRDVVAHLADQIVVLDNGAVVDRGPADALLTHPHHPLTRALLHTDPATAAAPSNP